MKKALLIMLGIINSFACAMENPTDDCIDHTEQTSTCDQITEALLQELSLIHNKIDKNKVTKLINYGADLYQKDSQGESALSYIVHRAMKDGKLDLIKCCCEKNINWKVPTTNGRSPYDTVSLAAKKYSRLSGMQRAQQVLEHLDEYQQKLDQLSSKDSE